MEPLAFARVSPAAASAAAPPAPVSAGSKPSSVAALFDAEESGLLRFAIGLVRRRTVAEELVQETFLRLHQVWADVENPRAWVYRTLRNLALNHLRDHRRETELPDDNVPAEDKLPAEHLGQNEAVGIMRMLLAELPAEDRELIQLKYRDELKYQEISRRTGLTVSNVGYRLHHLLKALAESLRRAGVEGSRG